MNFLYSIRKNMAVLFPNDSKTIDMQTKIYIVKRVFVFVAIVLFMAFFNREIYWILGSVVVAWLVTVVWHKSWINRINVKMLKALQVFVSDISFAYRCAGELEEAFRQVLLDTNGLMKMHGELLYEMISEGDYEENYRHYKEIAPNEYFLLFYAISHKTKQDGDTQIDGKSLYNDNLIMLGSEINRQLIYLEKTKNAFTGLMAMCIFPIFFIKPIEAWTISNLPELEGFFESVSSKIWTVVVLIIAMLILWVVTILKYPSIGQSNKNELINKIIAKGRIAHYLNRKIIKRYGYYQRIWKTIKEACDNSSIMEFVVGRYICVVIGALPAFLMAANIGISPLGCMVVASIGGIIGWWYPYIILKVKAFSIKSSLGEELIRFYTIIGMSRNQDNIDVREMLIQLELISIYYEEILKDTVNSYEGSGLIYLYRLKDLINDKYARRLVDGLIACDELEISEALSFVNSERDYLIASKHVKDEKSLSDRSAIAKFLAFIPFLVTMLIKLIVPFVMEGINQLQTFSSSLGTF